MLLEERRPKRSILSSWRNWLFALLFGLSICISDIRFHASATAQAEPEEDSPFSIAMLDSDVFAGEVDAASPPDAEMAEARDFVPPAEPLLLPYDRIIHEAAGLYGLDPDLIAAVIMTESQFNPGAVSKKGAKGLMQIMPVTAGALELGNVYSPEENIHGGSRHLKWLLDRFEGNKRLALAAYNAGLQNVLTYNGVPPFPETQAYVTKVLGCYSAIKSASIEF